MATILIVDDEDIFRRSLKKEISRYGRVLEAADMAKAESILEHSIIDVALVDLHLHPSPQEQDGLKLIEKCLKKNITSIVLTGDEGKEMIAKAYELGCRYYFSKFNFEEELHKILGPLLKSYDTKFQRLFNHTFITKDTILISKIKFILEQAYTFEHNILITGPTGVGKTRIAKMIHEFHHPQRPFVHVNLSALPDTLIESELFGHKKGAFTGALSDKIGLMEKADGGVLFFDEIGAIPLNIQKKLLKVIEEKKILPVGGSREISIDFKLITATCDDLSKKIQEGDFRLDFYFRIKGIEMEIPPLAKRQCDIIPLIDHMISKSSKKTAFDQKALRYLVQYDWPGNVRELENVLQELMIHIDGLITPDKLPSFILQNRRPFVKTPPCQSGIFTGEMKDILHREGLPSLVGKVQREALQYMMVENKSDGVNELTRRLRISKSLFYRIQKELQ